MGYRISGLDPDQFRHLFSLDKAALAARRAIRIVATGGDALPDRISLRDAVAGQSLLLVNHVHHDADNPFRSCHAIFVSEKAEHAARFEDEIPEVLRSRLLSIRAFDAEGIMVDADVVDGSSAEILIEKLLAGPGVSFLHAHFARRGCYAALIERTG